MVCRIFMSLSTETISDQQARRAFLSCWILIEFSFWTKGINSLLRGSGQLWKLRRRFDCQDGICPIRRRPSLWGFQCRIQEAEWEENWKGESLCTDLSKHRHKYHDQEIDIKQNKRQLKWANCQISVAGRDRIEIPRSKLVAHSSS